MAQGFPFTWLHSAASRIRVKIEHEYAIAHWTTEQRKWKKKEWNGIT